jgi:hypothetical protein
VEHEPRRTAPFPNGDVRPALVPQEGRQSVKKEEVSRRCHESKQLPQTPTDLHGCISAGSPHSTTHRDAHRCTESTSQVEYAGSIPVIGFTPSSGWPRRNGDPYPPVKCWASGGLVAPLPPDGRRCPSCRAAGLKSQRGPRDGVPADLAIRAWSPWTAQQLGAQHLW